MPDPQPRVVCWADVTEVTFTIGRHTILAGQYTSSSTSIDSFTARPFRGPAMPVADRQEAARLRAAALRIVGERMLPAMTAAYDAGKTVSCGAIHVSQHGITLAGTSVPVPWGEIRSVRLHSTRLSAGGSKVTSTVSLARSGRVPAQRHIRGRAHRVDTTSRHPRPSRLSGPPVRACPAYGEQNVTSG
jgi:hypothetical protein